MQLKMINQDPLVGTKVEIKAKEASMKIIALPNFKYLVIFANNLTGACQNF